MASIPIAITPAAMTITPAHAGTLKYSCSRTAAHSDVRISEPPRMIG
jgi:hypothetical protein